MKLTILAIIQRGDPKDQGGCNTVTQKANINVIPDNTPAAPYNHDDYTVAE